MRLTPYALRLTAIIIDFIGTKCPVGDTLIQGVRLQLAGVVRE